MATAGKTPAMGAAAILVLLFSATVITPASASTLKVFTGPGCGGQRKVINSVVCGCFSITGYFGGYHFVFSQGTKARLYRTPTCLGASLLLTGNKHFCFSHPFRGVRMIC